MKAAWAETGVSLEQSQVGSGVLVVVGQLETDEGVKETGGMSPSYSLYHSGEGAVAGNNDLLVR